MTKLEEWQKSPEPAAWLNGVLSTPMGRFFLDVMEEQSELRMNVNLPPAYLTANGSAMSGRILGYERCLARVRALAIPGAPSAGPIVETYGVTKPEEATE